MPTEPNLQGSIFHWLNSIYGDSATISLRATAGRILTRLEQSSAPAAPAANQTKGEDSSAFPREE